MDEFQQFFQYVQLKHYKTTAIKRFFRYHNNVYKYCYKVYNKSQYKQLYQFLYFVRFLFKKQLGKKCLICNKLLTQQQILSNRKFCSNKCAVKFDSVNRGKKAFQTTKRRYGKNGLRQIFEKGNEKRIKTLLEKYGVDNPAKNQSIKQKIKKTNLQRYGCQNPFQSKQIQQKIKQTNLKKYGYTCSLQNNKIKEKAYNSLIEKYGYNIPAKNKNISLKINETRKKQRFLAVIKRCEKYVIPLFKLQDYNSDFRTTQYKWKCVKCGNQWYQRLHASIIDGKQQMIPRCLKCYPYKNVGISQQQKQVFQFIQNIYNGNVICNKQIISPYQLDIYLPQKNLAIEFDGLYWHSEQILNERQNAINADQYHLNKTQLCLQKGIQLIHIFEDEWQYKQEIVKDRIKSLLGIDRNRIFARKCIIKEIDNNTKNTFLNQNHLQGQDNSKIKLGLYYNNELISVMTFGKPRFNRNYEYELIRFSSKLGYQVIGGAGKLLTYFQKNYHPKNLISYADRRYSNGKMYYSLGFQFLNNSSPNYWWYKGNVKYSRYQCQKHKLKQLLGDSFNPQLSEFQNMYLNGYNKIYDCGNMVFVKNY